jgi:hypothetical protein
VASKQDLTFAMASNISVWVLASLATDLRRTFSTPSRSPATTLSNARTRRERPKTVVPLFVTSNGPSQGTTCQPRLRQDVVLFGRSE